MKCERCDNEATVREVTVEGGVPIEKNYCEACAQKQGLVPQSQTPMNELLAKFGVPPAAGIVLSGPKGALARTAACPGCKMTFDQFQQAQLLGCPQCYETFAAQIGPIIERAHEGGTSHVGKTPRRLMGRGERGVADAAIEERAERLRTLRRRLEEAVAAEQYERAARIRDEMRRVSGQEPDEAAEGPSGQGAPRASS